MDETDSNAFSTLWNATQHDSPLPVDVILATSKRLTALIVDLTIWIFTYFIGTRRQVVLLGADHNGSTEPADHFLRTTARPIWLPCADGCGLSGTAVAAVSIDQ